MAPDSTWPSLSAFLDSSKRRLNQALERNEPVSFVTGNESADLDSMTSAVTYAYIHNLRCSASSAKTECLIPVVNIPKADLALRPEFKALLAKADVEPSQLVTLNDLLDGNEARITAEKSHWLLVDHNKLTGRLAEIYSSRVTGCIDHHEDEGAVSKDAEPRIIRKCGSCTSLIVKSLESSWAEGIKAEEKANRTKMSIVALASILIDTSNLKDENKVRPVDNEAVTILEAAIKEVDHDFDRTDLFHEISKAKANLDKLSVEEVLRKDYKAWPERLNIGISSTVLSLDALLAKAPRGTEGFLDAHEHFAQDRKLDLSVIMTAFSMNGKFCRELAVCAWNEKAVRTAKQFQSECTEELDLQEWKGEVNLDFAGKEHWIKAWDQRATQHSRKRVAPLLRKVANEAEQQAASVL